MAAELDEDRFVRLVGKHFVVLLFRLIRKDGQHIDDYASCFVIELDRTWFLMTAGHVIKNIADSVLGGATLSKLRLVDVFAGKSLPPLPVAFDVSDWVAIEEDGADFAALPLNPLVRAGLVAAGVVPLAESHVGAASLDAYSQVFLVGAPSETFMQAGTDGSVKLMMIPVKAHQPSEDHPQRGETVLAALPDSSPTSAHRVGDVQGMSGCPVFGLRQESETTAKYWVIGLQSTWYKGARVVRLCPLGRFIDALRKGLIAFRQCYEGEPGSAVP